MFIAVIRAANSRGTSFGISLFFSSLLSSGWPADLDHGGGQRDWGWYFFFNIPLVFHARSVISPVNFTKLAPTVISPCSLLLPLSPPASRGFCHTPSSLFFYSRFPATYARRAFFYRVYQQFIWLIVLPRVGHKNRYTDRVHRTRFVGSIAWRDSWIMSGRENDGK